MGVVEMSSSEDDLESLGLVEFLDALGRPACIARRAHHPFHLNGKIRKGDGNKGDAEHPPRDNTIEIVWRNDLVTSQLEGLILLASDAEQLFPWEGCVHSTEPKEILTEVPGQITGQRFRWRFVSLREGEYWAISGTEEACSTKPSMRRRQSSVTTVDSVASPTYDPEVSDVFIADTFHPFEWLNVIGRTPESKRFIETFRSVDWAKGKLGLPSTWSSSLLTMVNVCLSSPFPVLLSWGSDKVLLYNEPYSKVIESKHPRILGMPYDEAWPEVWDSLGPVVDLAYSGSVVHVDDQEMFLKRKNILEETYFTWSMIPLRGKAGKVEGLFIPNFDRTNAVITNRRLTGLHDISRHMSIAKSPEQVLERALTGLAANPRDLNFVVLYVAEHEIGHDIGLESLDSRSTSKRLAESTSRSGSHSHSRPSMFEGPGEEEVEIEFTLAGMIGAIDKERARKTLPGTVLSRRTEPVGDDEGMSLEKMIKIAHDTNELVLFEGSDMEVFGTLLQANIFGDMPAQVAVLPIRASTEDRIHGMLVVGLSTRLHFDEPYGNYLALVRTLLANGRAAAELHLEEKQRAEYLAAINRQKARELELALERKTQELKEAELKFTTAFGISPVGIWIARPDGHVEFANEVYREWSGLGDADNLDNWIDKVHPDDLAAVEAQFRLCYKTKVKHEFRFLTGETDESGVPTVRWIEGIAQAAVGPNINPETGEPEVLFATGALTDVTLRKQAEAFQARRADDNLAMRRQLEDFVDYASHEHRTPLFGMGMAIQSLKDHLQPLKNSKEAGQMQAVESALHDADIVSLCISHMQRLADDILLLSKLDRDMLVMAMAPCQPVQIARDVAKMVIAAERDVEYALSTSHQYDKLVEWISVDPQRVAQVLLNLVNNSIKFTRNRRSRKIKIHLDASLTKPPSNYPEFLENETIATTTTELQGSDPVVLVISVEDNGIGMEEAEAKKLFQRFQQGFRTSVTYGGSGLGLFLCKKITQKLGGDIALRTEPGVGSTFTFYVQAERCPPPSVKPSIPLIAQNLSHVTTSSVSTPEPNPTLLDPSQDPINEAAAKILRPPTPQEEKSAPTATRKIHVLLTEDNIINQRLLQRQLIKAGFNVPVANNGLEALEFVRNSTVTSSASDVPLDCILMDIEMPKMGGLECTAEIRKLEAEQTTLRRIPIIAVTANARQGQMQQILDSGFDDAVAKPFSTKELTARITALAHAYRQTT